MQSAPTKRADMKSTLQQHAEKQRTQGEGSLPPFFRENSSIPNFRLKTLQTCGIMKQRGVKSLRSAPKASMLTEEEDPQCPLILDSSPPRIRIIISSAITARTSPVWAASRRPCPVRASACGTTMGSNTEKRGKRPSRNAFKTRSRAVRGASSEGAFPLRGAGSGGPRQIRLMPERYPRPHQRPPLTVRSHLREKRYVYNRAFYLARHDRRGDRHSSDRLGQVQDPDAHGPQGRGGGACRSEGLSP